MSDTMSFDAIGFAGGGNRCYWQSGFFKALNAVYPQSPRYVVAVSAGAYHATINLAGIGERVVGSAFAFAADNRPDVDWRELRAGRSPLVVGGLFRRFLADQFGERELSALHAAPPILIQVARPPAWMPGAVAALGSIAAYQVEKAITGGAHSRAGRYLGLTAHWLSTHDLTTPAELVDAIMASSSVPPFMPVGRIAGRACLDGGLVDNPPVDKLGQVERRGGRTLLLTTRHGREPPSSPGRVVVSPSAPITVKKFTVGNEPGLRHAYELGLRDGEAFARDLPERLAA